MAMDSFACRSKTSNILSISTSQLLVEFIYMGKKWKTIEMFNVKMHKSIHTPNFDLNKQSFLSPDQTFSLQ